MPLEQDLVMLTLKCIFWIGIWDKSWQHQVICISINLEKDNLQIEKIDWSIQCFSKPEIKLPAICPIVINTGFTMVPDWLRTCMLGLQVQSLAMPPISQSQIAKKSTKVSSVRVIVICSDHCCNHIFLWQRTLIKVLIAL